MRTHTDRKQDKKTGTNQEEENKVNDEGITQKKKHKDHIYHQSDVLVQCIMRSSPEDVVNISIFLLNRKVHFCRSSVLNVWNS